jgi:hypothetical protein
VVRSTASAKAVMEASSVITIQGTTCACWAGPVHCVMVTAIACAGPDRIASSTRQLRKASA